DGGERLVQAGPVSVAPGEAVIEVDPVLVDAELEQRHPLRSRVLLVQRAPGVPDPNSGHDRSPPLSSSSSPSSRRPSCSDSSGPSATQTQVCSCSLTPGSVRIAPDSETDQRTPLLRRRTTLVAVDGDERGNVSGGRSPNEHR